MIRASFSEGRVVPRTAGGLLFSMEDFVHRADPSRLSVDVLAREFFVSRRRLYRLFEQIHTSPGDYVRRARLATAARMLQLRRQTITDIAAACGFDDATTFTRAFRREYGMTPRDWRGTSASSVDLVA
jgi:AraC-like DNA-binding protein